MKKLLSTCTLLPLFLLLLFSVSGSEAAIKYKVKKGDSLYTIAKKYHVTVKDLESANKASAKGLKPGDRIIVPSQKKEASSKTKSAEHEKDSVSNKKTTKDSSVSDDLNGPSRASSGDLYHVVKKGDTLVSISHKYSVSIGELKELNSLNKSGKLKKGQRLLVRSDAPKTYTVRKGDTIWNIARKFNLDAEELMEINEMESPSVKTGQNLYLYETQPVLTGQQDDTIIIKTLEEELKSASESENFSHNNLRDKLTLFAKKMLNIPYKFGGNSILGIDCSAYVKKVYGFLGMDLPRTAREQFNEGEAIDKEELSIGDLVFFRTYASFPSHVGIYLGNNLFIHASSRGKKVKVDSLDTPYFVKRFIGAKRLLTDEDKSADPRD
jgi:cell wall-associated NlpC family hydrolase